METNKTVLFYAFCTLAAIGLISIVWAIISFIRVKIFKSRMVKTSAVIIDVREWEHKEERKKLTSSRYETIITKYYIPIYTFYAKEDNKKYEAESSSSSLYKFKIGEIVEIHYDSKYPEKTYLANDNKLSTLIGWLIAGIVFLMIAAIVYLAWRYLD